LTGDSGSGRLLLLQQLMLMLPLLLLSQLTAAARSVRPTPLSMPVANLCELSNLLNATSVSGSPMTSQQAPAAATGTTYGAPSARGRSCH